MLKKLIEKRDHFREEVSRNPNAYWGRRLIIFLLIVGLMLFYLVRVFDMNDTKHSEQVFQAYYKLPKNTVDVVYTGSSAAYRYYSPYMACAETGITSFDLNSASQPIILQEPIINEALLMASDIPVFTGVGGGLTKGHRVVNLAMYAEMQGAMGVVVNVPTSGLVISRMRRTIDIPIVVTVANHGTDYARRIDDGAAIFNVAAGSATAEIVAEIRAQYPDIPIMATGGPSDESILRTIDAGANAITYTPPSSAELFKHTMERYRMGLPYE